MLGVFGQPPDGKGSVKPVSRFGQKDQLLENASLSLASCGLKPASLEIGKVFNPVVYIPCPMGVHSSNLALLDYFPQQSFTV